MASPIMPLNIPKVEFEDGLYFMLIRKTCIQEEENKSFVMTGHCLNKILGKSSMYPDQLQISMPAEYFPVMQSGSVYKISKLELVEFTLHRPVSPVSIEMVQLTGDPWNETEAVSPFPDIKLSNKIPISRIPLLTVESAAELRKLVPKPTALNK